MTVGQKIKIDRITRFEKRALFISACIPIFIISIAVVRELLEFYFRLSREYKWVYSYGSFIGLVLQMLLLLFSIAFSIYLLLGKNMFKNKLIWLAAILVGISPVLYILLSFLVAY